MLADGGVALQHHVGADAGLGADVDASQVQQAAFDAGVLQVHGVADAGAGADRHQIGHAHGGRAQGDLGAHARAQRAQPQRVQRRAVDHVGGHGLGQPVGQPPAVVGAAPQRVAAGFQPPGDEPLAGPGEGELGHRRGQEGEQRQGDGLRHRVVRVAGVEVVSEEGRQPLRHLQQHQRRDRQRLRDTAAPAPPCAVQHEGPRGRAGAGGPHARPQRLGDAADLAVLVDVGHGGLGEARILPQGRGQARGEQRMPAQVAEEVQRAPDGLAGEQLVQRGEQRFLGRRVGLVAAFGRRGGGQRQALERLAVDLAAGQARHGGQRFEARRDHVGRQLVRQAASQHGGGKPVGGGHVEGHQLVDVLVLAQQHGRGAHAGPRGQHGLDFAQLDAKAADLHLVVHAAQALHARRAVGRRLHARQVAGAVQARFVRVARPRVGQELLGRQLGPAQVAGGHAGAGDAQLARRAEGQEPERRRLASVEAVGVDRLDDQQAVVGQRLADGHRLVRLQLGQRRRHRGLGRAVGVEKPTARRPAVHQGLRAHLAAQVDQAQAGHVLREQRQQRGHGVQHGHAVLGQRARQRLGVAGQRLGRDPQRGAHQVADPDLLEAHVEGHREALVHAVVLAHAQARVLAAQEVADAGLRDGDALGLAGGAAGVDDVGRVRGQCAFAAAQRRAGGHGGEQFAGSQDWG